MYLVKLAAETKTELVIPAKNVRIAAGSATGHVPTATEYAVSSHWDAVQRSPRIALTSKAPAIPLQPAVAVPASANAPKISAKSVWTF